ncbi:hypothetical protein T484DRAFT_1906261 [Baffinella frigidus]|nr:hypothetical protein T484DRAFT_1906261 [Cryptophyta sp. CCMP2293]
MAISAADEGRAGPHTEREHTTGGRVSPRGAESSASHRPGGSVGGANTSGAVVARRRGACSAMAVVLAVMLSVAAALPGPGARHLPPRLSRLGIRQPRLGIRPCAEGPFAEGMFGALRLRGGIDTAAEEQEQEDLLAPVKRAKPKGVTDKEDEGGDGAGDLDGAAGGTALEEHLSSLGGEHDAAMETGAPQWLKGRPWNTPT